MKLGPQAIGARVHPFFWLGGFPAKRVVTLNLSTGGARKSHFVGGWLVAILVEVKNLQASLGHSTQDAKGGPHPKA